MKYSKYPELKMELKKLAKEIKKFKNMRDHWWDYQEHEQWYYQGGVLNRAHEFRHLHIVYCMFRGRKYEEIERYCHESPDWQKIEQIKLKYERKNLHSCS